MRIVVAGLLAAAAAQGPRWERKAFEVRRPERGCYISRCCQSGLGVWTREVPGTAVREVKAAGEIDAPPAKVFEVVTDYEHQAGNLPYVDDQKVLERTGDEVVHWAVASFPLVAPRDWVVRSRLERDLPGGIYRATWEPVEWKDAPPPGDGVVRLRINSGSWTLEPLDGGARTRATYTLLTDPGGSIPSFMANQVNTGALADLFAAVRRRAEQ